MLELWRLLGRPARGRLALALVLSAMAGASGVFLLGLSGWFLTASAMAGLSGGGYLFNHLYPSAGVRAAAFARVLTRYGEQLVGHDATLGISAALRPEVFAASARRRRGFAPMPAADLSAITDDIDAAEAGFLKVISPLLAITAGAVVALGFAFAASALSGFVTLATLLLAAAFLPLRVIRAGEAGAVVAAELAEAAREETARLVENAVELDTLDALPRIAVTARQRLDDAMVAQQRNDRLFRHASVFTSLCSALAALFLVWRGAVGSADLAISVAAALALIAALDAAAGMVSVLSAANTSARAAGHLAERIRKPDADWTPPETAAVRLDGVFPIRAEGLMISPALRAEPIGPFDFCIEQGEAVQLLGPSGSGKSTLAETLMRLHPPVGGYLSFAGHPAGQVRIAGVLEHVAYAPQLPAFLPGRLIDQLRLADPNASQAAILTALGTACADEFVAKSPAGLNTVFTEGDYPFSGGELRRIAIARALLVNPDLLILDEPLAGLDDALAVQLGSNIRNWIAGGPRSLLILGHQATDVFGMTAIWLTPAGRATIGGVEAFRLPARS